MSRNKVLRALRRRRSRRRRYEHEAMMAYYMGPAIEYMGNAIQEVLSRIHSTPGRIVKLLDVSTANE